MDIEIRFATPTDAPAVVEVLADAAAKMNASGARGWRSGEIGLAHVVGWASNNEAVVALRGLQIVGVMLVQTHDLAYWPDKDDNLALYLHKLAIRRSEAGKGIPAALVEWAADYAGTIGKQYLRLDCGPWPKLCSVYERLAFNEIDRIPTSDGMNVRFERRVNGAD